MMDEERMRILQMVEDGKVTPEEGARLMEAVARRESQALQVGPGGAARALRVRVTEGDGEQTKVNVTVPLSLARLALRFIPRTALETLEDEGITADDLAELIASVEKAGPMRIVDVQADNAKVEVFVE
jgi:hypothetical protein